MLANPMPMVTHGVRRESMPGVDAPAARVARECAACSSRAAITRRVPSVSRQRRCRLRLVRAVRRRRRGRGARRRGLRQPRREPRRRRLLTIGGRHVMARARRRVRVSRGGGGAGVHRRLGHRATAVTASREARARRTRRERGARGEGCVAFILSNEAAAIRRCADESARGNAIGAIAGALNRAKREQSVGDAQRESSIGERFTADDIGNGATSSGASLVERSGYC